MAWYPCCCSDRHGEPGGGEIINPPGEDCYDCCQGTAADLLVTIPPGFLPNPINPSVCHQNGCLNIVGEYVLSRDPARGPCVWSYVEDLCQDVPCNPGPGPYRVYLVIQGQIIGQCEGFQVDIFVNRQTAPNGCERDLVFRYLGPWPFVPDCEGFPQSLPFWKVDVLHPFLPGGYFCSPQHHPSQVLVG